MNSVKNVYDNLIEWYWSSGQERNKQCMLDGYPEYELTSDWAWQLYQGKIKAHIAEKGMHRNKPALAIWGPSQVGKSTLLARYIDASARSDGYGSGLHWSESEPILFEKKSDSPEDVLTWNPYNFGADASACITCFRLKREDETFDHNFPIGLTLASPKQILYALACGYLNECRLDESTGSKVTWTFDELENLLQNQGRNQLPSQQIFEELLPIVELLENLVEEGNDRFSRLRGKSPGRLILRHAGTFESVEAVHCFASKLFWDDHAPLTKLYSDLITKLEEFEEIAQDNQIYCSYQFARLLNNIGIYSRLSGGTHPDGTTIDVHQPTRDLVYDITFTTKDQNVLLDVGSSSGTKLIKENNDFALIQGIIWELDVPLNPTFLENSDPSRPLTKLLEKADLLDFPGIAKEGHKIDEQRIPVKTLDSLEYRHLLYSKVLKRGKTASILFSSAREARIDNLSILVKANEHLGQAAQIYQGVSIWWQTITNEDFPKAKTKQANLNLVITFFGTVINDVILNPGHAGIAQAFERFDCLNSISNPRVSTIFVTNYHQYCPLVNTQRNTHATAAELNRAKKDLLSEKTLVKLFENNKESIESVFEGKDGGTDYFLSVLFQQARASNFRTALENLYLSSSENFKSLILEAIPIDNINFEKSEWIEKWRNDFYQSLYNRVKDSGGLHCLTLFSKAIRKLTNVSPEALNPVPKDLKNHRQGKAIAERYVKVQVENWKTSMESYSFKRDLGLNEDKDFQLALNYLGEGINAKEFGNWLYENFGFVKSYGQRQMARRMLAIRLSDYLMRSPRETCHYEDNGCNQWLDQVSSMEGSQNLSDIEEQMNNDSHYYSVILPFLGNLSRISGIPSSERPNLPGDSTLIEIHQSIL